MKYCPLCGERSFEFVCESGDWFWMCHDCDHVEEEGDQSQRETDEFIKSQEENDDWSDFN